jgi:hypothetical protein
MKMEKRLVFKTFIYFLCISFLLLTNGFHTMVAEAKGIDRPIGEMVSRGEVKFESRENVWKDVEPSQFPIFRGAKIKTGKGGSIITLPNDSQIEVGQNSLLSFDRNDQMRLVQGTIDFRFPSSAELSFKVGNLTVTKYRSLHASKNPSAVQENGETIGSIFVHPNGSFTVKSIRGSLSIVNQEHVVLAALSSKDAVTIPSITANSPSKVMVAQAGETKTGGAETENWEFWGISTWGWIGIIAGLGAVGGIIGATTSHHGGGGHGFLPLCP